MHLGTAKLLPRFFLFCAQNVYTNLTVLAVMRWIRFQMEEIF